MLDNSIAVIWKALDNKYEQNVPIKIKGAIMWIGSSQKKSHRWQRNKKISFLWNQLLQIKASYHLSNWPSYTQYWRNVGNILTFIQYFSVVNRHTLLENNLVRMFQSLNYYFSKTLSLINNSSGWMYIWNNLNA